MRRRGITKLQATALMIIMVAAIALTVAFGLSQLYSTGPSPSTHQFDQAPARASYVIDFMGRNVTIPENVTRIVAIGPGALRLVCYLKAVDLLVGVEESEIKWGFVGRDYAMAYGEAFKSLQIIGPGGPGKPPNPELILQAKPDLIIMSRTYAEMYDPDRLESETKAKVVVVDYGEAGYLDVDGLAKALRMLGLVLNRSERAEELIRYVNSIVEDLSSRTEKIAERPKVYVGAISYRGPQPFTTTQVAFPPLKLLHTPSIADKYSDKPGVLFWSFETILLEQPDVVFIDQGNLATVLSDFGKDPSKYLQLKAFRDGNVYGIIPYNYYHTNVATALANAYYMGKVLYPKSFEGVDPEKKADEIFTVFVGKPIYQLYKEGYGGFRNLSDLFKVP
ncbi:MAG: ABC transporter substrate-binding protein [Candidatus Nezhaarchaeota archaeon]|nr:ABC transporter substrate-binding protein [Candidatus Nezhaarchaeota archaeon]